jgi:glycosyltransferase involved in cell wall biosynthesis
MIPRYNREIFSLPERVVVHTRFHADLVRRFAPGARITVRPLPVSVPLDRSLSKKSPISLPFSSRDIVLTIFGFMERRKDYLGVLEALTRLPPEYKLLIAGGCHDERERESPESVFGKIMGFVERNNLAGRVHVTGFFPDGAMSDLIEATTVVVAPFRESHSSASINIGIAYSRPVLAYRTRLTEEMNRNGAGILEVDGGDDLAQLMRTYTNAPGFFQGAVKAGSEYRSRYGFPVVAAQFFRWYEELLGDRGRSGAT